MVSGPPLRLHLGQGLSTPPPSPASDGGSASRSSSACERTQPCAGTGLEQSTFGVSATCVYRLPSGIVHASWGVWGPTPHGRSHVVRADDTWPSWEANGAHVARAVSDCIGGVRASAMRMKPVRMGAARRLAGSDLIRAMGDNIQLDLQGDMQLPLQQRSCLGGGPCAQSVLAPSETHRF